MKRFWFIFWLSIIVSLLGGGLFYVALQRSHPKWSQLNLIDTALSIVVALLSGMAAGLFLRGVRNFTQKLQRAYLLLCAGIALFGVAQAQYPIASYSNASFWYIDGFIAIPYLIAVLFVFWGLRRFAQILAIRTRWASWGTVLLFTVLTVPAVVLLPHARSDYSTAQIASTNALTAANCVFLTCAAVTALRIRRTIGPLYVGAIRWLYIALVVNIVAGVHYAGVNLLFARVDNWYFYDSVTIWPFLAGAILLVRAGYAMVLVNQASSAEGETLPAAHNVPPQPLPIIHIITYVAGLVSKPEEIDATLDTLRVITAQLQPGQPLTPAEEQQLIAVYHAIEQYLVTKEPLKTFTTAALQDQVTRHFKLVSTTATRLWPVHQTLGSL